MRARLEGQTALQPQPHQGPGPSPGWTGRPGDRHEAGRESVGVSGVLLLEPSVKSKTAQWSAQGMYNVSDLCV